MLQNEKRRIDLEAKRAGFIDRVAELEKENARGASAVGALKTACESTEHLEKVLSLDPKAIADANKIAEEITHVEQGIENRLHLIERLRAEAEKLGPDIDRSRCVEVLDVVELQRSKFQDASRAFDPFLAAAVDAAKAFEQGRVALEMATRKLPDQYQNWLGRYFLHDFSERFRAALMIEITRNFAPPGSYSLSSSEFSATSSLLFSNVERAFATISATVAGGGQGRKLYRTVGNVSGLSGGLRLSHGEVVALLDDAETKRLFDSGALEVVLEDQKP